MPDAMSTRIAAPVPGFRAPAAGFDAPLDMLHACHERIHRSLDLLGRICERVRQERVDAAVHEAAADVLRYFDKAAPHHHEDEEQHVFPRVLAGTANAEVRAVVVKLQQDHQQMEALWARLRTPLAALSNGHAEGFHEAACALAQEFRALYESHARTEETLVFPAAEALIDDDTREAMGREMARRRGARW